MEITTIEQRGLSTEVKEIVSLKRYGFLSYARDSSNKNGKKVLDTATKQIKKSSSKLLPLSKKCNMNAGKKR